MRNDTSASQTLSIFGGHFFIFGGPGKLILLHRYNVPKSMKKTTPGCYANGLWGKMHIAVTKFVCGGMKSCADVL